MKKLIKITQGKIVDENEFYKKLEIEREKQNSLLKELKSCREKLKELQDEREYIKKLVFSVD